MTSKSRGYLLVDLSIALSIFSILSFGIFTFYRTYKRIDKDNKKKIECLNYIDYISMELKYNLDFSILERRLEFSFEGISKCSLGMIIKICDRWLEFINFKFWKQIRHDYPHHLIIGNSFFFKVPVT